MHTNLCKSERGFGYRDGTSKCFEIYLPKQLSEEELTKELNIIDSLGASSISDIGRVMGKAMGLLKGKADGAWFQNHQRATELNGLALK